MTSRYLPRLNVSRIRSVTPQMKLTISPWFIEASPHSRYRRMTPLM
jgi:hypothetical protein